MNPKYDDYMKPLLELLNNNKTYEKRDIYEIMSRHFNLTDDDMAETIPSGTQPTYMNRIGWALTYLKKAKLIESPSRALFKITERGKDAVKKLPNSIDKSYLMKYKEFEEFQSNAIVNKDKKAEILDESPEDLIGKYHQELKNIIISDLLEEVLKMSPKFFEKLVLDLLENMGYGEAEGTPYINDQGIDGIVKSDKLGLEKIYIQAKRYAENNIVGRPELNAFVGALLGKKGSKGVFITTSSFSKPAIDYADSISEKIILIDGKRLGELLYEFNVGLQKANSYIVKKIDRDYFEE